MRIPGEAVFLDMAGYRTIETGIGDKLLDTAMIYAWIGVRQVFLLRWNNIKRETIFWDFSAVYRVCGTCTVKKIIIN